MCEGDGTDPKQGDEGDLGVGGGGEDENAVQKQGEYRQVHQGFGPMFFKQLNESLHTLEYSTIIVLVPPPKIRRGDGEQTLPKLHDYFPLGTPFPNIRLVKEDCLKHTLHFRVPFKIVLVRKI
jgi:hypothetical protein